MLPWAGAGGGEALGYINLGVFCEGGTYSINKESRGCDVRVWIVCGT